MIPTSQLNLAETSIPCLDIDAATRSNYRIIPSHLQILHSMNACEWNLDQTWQSAGLVYRVLNDLYTKQRFQKLCLVYLRIMRLCVICGVEPTETNAVNRRNAEVLSDENTSGEALEQPGEHLPQSIDSASASSEPNSTETNDSQNPFVFVIPGHYRSAKLSGKFRRDLAENLNTVSKVFIANGRLTKPGWLLAISDGNDVAYYAERQIVLQDIWDASSIDGTRDSTLAGIFGDSWAINKRTAVRKEEKKEMKRMAALEKLMSNNDWKGPAAMDILLGKVDIDTIDNSDSD